MDALTVHWDVTHKTVLIHVTVEITVVGRSVISINHQMIAWMVLMEFGGEMFRKFIGGTGRGCRPQDWGLGPPTALCKS